MQDFFLKQRFANACDRLLGMGSFSKERWVFICVSKCMYVVNLLIGIEVQRDSRRTKH